MAGWPTERTAQLALAVEEAALAADSRIVGVEQAVYADAAEGIAISSSTGTGGEFEVSSCYAYLQALAEEAGGRETGLGFGLARGPGGLDPAAIGREGAERATAMIGAGKPASSTCAVVLDPTVAASFVGLLGSTIGADAVQRGRSPLAGRVGEEVAGEAFVLHDDGLDPGGFATAPIDGEGLPRRRTALIEGGRLQTYLYDTYTARRGGFRVDRQRRSRAGYRSQPSVFRFEPRRRGRRDRIRGAAGRGRRRRLGQRRRGASLGGESGHRRLFGRRLGPGDQGRRPGRAAAGVHDRERPRLDAPRGSRGRSRAPMGAVRGLRQHPGAADRRDGVSGPEPATHDAEPLHCRRPQRRRRSFDVTKAEFLDQLAADERVGSKKAAGDAVDAVLETISDTLAGGGEVSFTGFGKFHVAERGPRQGVNPRTGERITIPGGRVPRFSAGSALKAKVKG